MDHNTFIKILEEDFYFDRIIQQNTHVNTIVYKNQKQKHATAKLIIHMLGGSFIEVTKTATIATSVDRVIVTARETDGMRIYGFK